jgi:GTP cyclohydrolase IB
MSAERRYLVDVGLQDLPYPVRVASRSEPDGQHTIASISIAARLHHEFEATWISRLIQIVHNHRDKIATSTLKKNVQDYLEGLNANDVSVTFSYPFFVEKLTPVSKEKCLVRVLCAYTAKSSSSIGKPRVTFKIQVPCLTTYPSASTDRPGGLFGQLSTLLVQTESDGDIYPEDIVDLVDGKALAPIYSYLSEKDEELIIRRVHAVKRTSVEVTDDVGLELSKRKDIGWFSIRCSNYGMLHSYATVLGTEKSVWTPREDWEEIGKEVMPD